MTETPGISCGYWKARNMPALARTSVGQSVMSSPWYTIEPLVTSYSGDASSALASVLLPDPLGPMIACTSPVFTVQRQPTQDLGRRASSVSAGRACRSSIRKSSVTAPVYFPYRRSGNPASTIGAAESAVSQ